MCADVTSPDLNFPPETVDLIFTHSLLINLSDKEVEDIARRLLKWVKVGGYIFFIESCSQQSEEHKKKNNLEYIREPRYYTKIFWIWQKVVKSEDDVDKGFQQFLDNVQYKFSGLLRYERIFGYGFVSPGGIDTTKEFVAKLDLKPVQKVLDVGCGIGGSDFYMAETFGVEVVGIDLSVNMISLALERAIGLECAVEFDVADCTKKSYPDDTLDVIYSRDTILHIQDKPALFQTFYKWLKPGGKVLISDYCRKFGTPSEDFAEYIKQRG